MTCKTIAELRFTTLRTDKSRKKNRDKFPGSGHILQKYPAGSGHTQSSSVPGRNWVVAGYLSHPEADPEILKKGEGEDNASAPLSFFATAHTKLYAFYTGVLQKNSEPML